MLHFALTAKYRHRPCSVCKHLGSENFCFSHHLQFIPRTNQQKQTYTIWSDFCAHYKKQNKKLTKQICSIQRLYMFIWSVRTAEHRMPLLQGGML